MSPASQGNHEVERYIGSCLISSSVRSALSGKTLSTAISKKHQQQDIVSLRGKQQRDYTQQGNYQPLNNEPCQYGTWAGGAPLISMTSSPRRNNQRSSPPPSQNLQQQQSTQQQQQQGQQIQTHMQNQSPLSRLAIHTQGAPLILAGRYHNRGKIQSCNVTNGTPINKSSGTSIINANVNGVNYSNGNNVGVAAVIGNSMIGSAGKSPSAQVQRLAESVRKPQQQQQLNSKGDCSNVKVDGANIANIDSLSIASDESSGSNNSENSLPRIIKPRKRRKKDRKPAGSSVITEIPPKTDDLQQQNHQQQQQQQQQHQQQQNQQQQNNQQHHQNNSNPPGISEQSSIVTLKPYVPICYGTRYEQNWGHRRPPPQNTRESYLRSQNQSVSCNGPMQQQPQQLGQQQMHHQQQEIIDTRQQQQQQHHHQQHQQQQRYQQRHVQVKVVDDKRNIVVPTTSTNMLNRSMSLTSKPIITNNGNYHNRNHHHHVAHHHHHHHHHHNSEARNTNNGNSGTPNVTNGVIVNSISHNRYQQQQQHYHQSQHDYNESMLINCEDNAGLADGSAGSLGSAGCQCRYCDPSGLIWDVDQNGYSPFLTPPHSGEFSTGHDYATSQHHQQYPHLPLFLSRNMSAITCHDKSAANGCEYFELAESPSLAVTTAQRGHHHNNHNNHRHHISCLADSRCGETAGATISTCSTATTGNSSTGTPTTSAVTMLRRSWSDPTSYFSEEITVPNRDVGVIGDRGQNEINRGKSSWPGNAVSGLTSGSTNNSPYGNLANLPPAAKQGLEVSTEIVTSPNGHRDLEIKFYSTSPCALPPDDDKSAFLDDGEDFSDIWSYHESKLQQDFRTLLQAEE